MILRYVILHGLPKTSEDWEKYREWKDQQLALAECQMMDLEGGQPEDCAHCPGKPDCPKANRRRT